MKRKLSLIVIVLVGFALVLCLSSCKPTTQKEYPVIPVAVNSELGCVELIYDGIIYRPYGVIGSSKLRGEQIGIREDITDGKGIVCEVQNYEPSEWLIDYLDVFMGGGDTLYKAVGVTEIPTELEQYQEYDF